MASGMTKHSPNRAQGKQPNLCLCEQSSHFLYAYGGFKLKQINDILDNNNQATRLRNALLQ